MTLEIYFGNKKIFFLQVGSTTWRVIKIQNILQANLYYTQINYNILIMKIIY